MNEKFPTESNTNYNLDSNTQKSEESGFIVEKKDPKNVSGPKNQQDWKIHDVGVNHIQKQPFTIQTINHWTVSLTAGESRFDADAFARYVKQDACCEHCRTEAEYIEERIEKDREAKEKNPASKIDPKSQIKIQRLDAA